MKRKTMVAALLCAVMLGAAGCAPESQEAESSLIAEASSGAGPEQNQEAEASVLEEGQEASGEQESAAEDCGVIKETGKEFFGDSGELSYYYKVEGFYFNDPFSAAINDTLQQIYDAYEAGYLEEAEKNQSGLDEFGEPMEKVPYSYLHLLGVPYAGEDYVSLLYNDICDMGGAHPYSRWDGITIDCRTGEQVSASELLQKEEEDILEEISSTMGMDVTATWDDVDFYLTDTEIVFFYRMPGYWDDVVMQRNP